MIRWPARPKKKPKTTQPGPRNVDQVAARNVEQIGFEKDREKAARNVKKIVNREVTEQNVTTESPIKKPTKSPKTNKAAKRDS